MLSSCSSWDLIKFLETSAAPQAWSESVVLCIFCLPNECKSEMMTSPCGKLPGPFLVATSGWTDKQCVVWCDVVFVTHRSFPWTLAFFSPARVLAVIRRRASAAATTTTTTLEAQAGHGKGEEHDLRGAFYAGRGAGERRGGGCRGQRI